MSTIDYGTLKKGGFMRQVQKERFSLRLKVVGGQLGAVQLRKAAEVAEKYGRGYVHLTSRQGLEIPFVALADIEAVKADLAEGGLQPGVCGPRVRTVTACQGSTICPSGLIDTTALAQDLDSRYFGRELPHKFKFGITGCPNNCLKAEENDLGVKGAVLPAWNKAACTYCGLCEAVCPPKAIVVEQGRKTLAFDETKCVYCGKCVKSCPASAWTGKNGYLIAVGGMFGNEISAGLHLIPLLFSAEQVFKVADAVVAFFEKHAKPGERLAKTIRRVGLDELKAAMREAL